MNAPIYAIAAESLSFDGKKTSGFFEGCRGQKLRYALFFPESERPLGTIVLVQGRNECIEKYLEAIRDLVEHGFVVAGFDLRGQALSGRLGRNERAGHVHRFNDYVVDVERFLTFIVKPSAPGPYSILAHSLGGLIALALAPRVSGTIHRMVLSAPLVGLMGLPVPESFAFGLAALASWTGLGKMPMGKERGPVAFANNLLTTSPARFERFATLRRTRPELGIGPPTARWLHEVRKAMKQATTPQHLTRITVPTLILAPVQDRIVPYKAMEDLARQFRAAHLVPVPGARHELLQEDDRYRSQALAAILAFIMPDEPPASVSG